MHNWQPDPTGTTSVSNGLSLVASPAGGSALCRWTWLCSIGVGFTYSLGERIMSGRGSHGYLRLWPVDDPLTPSLGRLTLHVEGSPTATTYLLYLARLCP